MLRLSTESDINHEYNNNCYRNKVFIDNFFKRFSFHMLQIQQQQDSTFAQIQTVARTLDGERTLCVFREVN